jgi:hypothetical protein
LKIERSSAKKITHLEFFKDMSKILKEFKIDVPDWQTDLKEWVAGYTKSFKIKLLQE